MQWDRLQNGELLAAAERAGFFVMISCDQSIERQQNNEKRVIALVVLGSNDWDLIQGITAQINKTLDRCVPNSFFFLELPPVDTADRS